MKVFLTGITGFVGRAVSERLLSDGHQVLAPVRGSVQDFPGVQTTHFADFVTHDWAADLAAQQVVVHCAARVHVMSEDSMDPLADFRQVNVEGTLSLARAAARVGVKRFIFISSIKVSGEATEPDLPFTADGAARPLDPYGITKYEAEQQLQTLASETGMEVTIIRPVLVYGPGVKANFLSMMEWLSKGVPLPFGALTNKRSLVALDNLVDLIVTCLEHPSAVNEVFLVSDGEDLSTTELLRLTAKALGKSARLIPVPAWMISTAAQLLGKPAIAQRLCGSLQVDIEKTRVLLGWRPPVSIDEALYKTTRDYLEKK